MLARSERNERSVIANRLREPTYSPVLNPDARSEKESPEYPPCRRSEGIDPPFCCQPPMTPEIWAERGARIAAALARADAARPKACPGCAGPVIPCFRDYPAYSCGAMPACGWQGVAS